MNQQNASDIDYKPQKKRPVSKHFIETQGCKVDHSTLLCNAPLKYVFIDLVIVDDTRMNYFERPTIHIEMPVDKAHLKQVAKEFEAIADKLKGIVEAIEDEEAAANQLTLPEVA